MTMAEDRYERVLLSLIDYHKKWIEKAERDIKTLNIPHYDPNWSDKNLGMIEVKDAEIKTYKTKISTIWVCLNHYRSLIGVNQ
jgi:hypothetical protein